ncbi:MAG: 23S rRNA (guanosine(2251)-2'-O)-methyltransferase RlmB [Clostridia bacterium]|nr:23S rRNA (guanosine(2251)-2'-O)-methyltransferase RlmB [Clostridia bacterium]
MTDTKKPYFNRENRGSRESRYQKHDGYSDSRKERDGNSTRKGRDADGTSTRYSREQKREGGYKNKREYKRDDYKKPESPEVRPAENPDELPFLILGRNAVREAIKSERSLDYIMVSKEQDGSLKEILSLARDKKLVIREVDRKKLDEVCMPFGHGGKTANHQGIVAYAAGVSYCSVSDILATAKERNEPPFVIVLDGVEDPHNLGSIIRSAECAGAHGVIIGKRRSASVTAATVKASAGATSHMNIARVVNINGAIEELKRANCWIAGADMSGRPMRKQGLNGALALVIGNEGEGLSKLVRDNCDFLVSIPIRGKIESLNAAVAAAILMFEKNRQDEELSSQNG